MKTTTIDKSLWFNARIASQDPTIAAPFGMLEQDAVLVENGRIRWIGHSDAIELDNYDGEQFDAKGQVLTPGLIDSHTHLVFGGQRSAEFEARLQGESYQTIARNGGGILSTVNATRALSETELVQAALPRLGALCREGVTTVEIKSGYGLTLDDELKMLRAARRLEQLLPVRVRTTLLAAHAVPPEYQHDPDAYVDLICNSIIPQAAEQGLAQAVDVFCEGIGFNVEQCRRLFYAAREHGLGIKGHMEQLSNLGGSKLAAEFNAWSVDHLEHLDSDGIKALQGAGTVATLLPGAFYFLGETLKPPVAALLEAGVPLALATDLNPGSSPLASLRLMMNMGCTLFGLTPEQALTAVTRNGAQALGLGNEVGMIKVGQQADMLLWDIEHPAQLAYEFGPQRLVQRIFAGKVTDV
ncbi:MAG: imidazolonepropionase [Motiliproteus sp.]